MKNLTIAFAFLVAGAAFADEPKATNVPQMAATTPGPEQKALDRFVGTTTFEGTSIMPGTGKPSKETVTVTCKKVAGDMWLACDTDGTPADAKLPKLHGHYILGWDLLAKEYREYVATVQGISGVVHGKLEGNKLVMLGETYKMPEHTVQNRVTIDMSDPKKLHQVSERSIDGGPFQLAGDFTSK